MYSHDGLKDSLTNLAAPGLFYEELRRGILRTERSGNQLSLIRLILGRAVKEEFADESNLQLPDDMEILKFADILLRLTRGEDLCARMGEMEFIVLLFAPQPVAKNYIQRVSREWNVSSAERNDWESHISVKIIASCLTSQSGQSALELLQNLDHIPLTSYA